MHGYVFLNAHYESCKEKKAYNRSKLTQEEYYKIQVEIHNLINIRRNNILHFDNNEQVEALVYEVMVELYKIGKKFVSLGEVCEHLGVDKSTIPVIYYNEYYELDDFYKENPDIGTEKLNNTIH